MLYPSIAASDVLHRLCREGNAGFHQQFASAEAHQRQLIQTPAVYHALLNVAAQLGRKALPSNDGVCEILAAALRVHFLCIMVQHRIECGASKLDMDAVYREWMNTCPSPSNWVRHGKPLLTGSDMGQSGRANVAAVAVAENDDMLKTRGTEALGAARVAEKSLVAGSGIEAGGADENADDAARLESDSESSSNSIVGAVTVATLPMAVEEGPASDRLMEFGGVGDADGAQGPADDENSGGGGDGGPGGGEGGMGAVQGATPIVMDLTGYPSEAEEEHREDRPDPRPNPLALQPGHEGLKCFRRFNRTCFCRCTRKKRALKKEAYNARSAVLA
jgi:hypothetical protein